MSARYRIGIGRGRRHEQQSKVHRPTGRRARTLGDCCRASSATGAAARIEFAALALPFSFLVFAILESCISFAGQQVMANATDDIARRLRTGQIRAADVNEAKLKKMICDQLEIMVAKDCPGLRGRPQAVSDLRRRRRRSRSS